MTEATIVQYMCIAISQDRHGEGNFQPLVDDQQDYKVHLAMERDDFTIFQFSRKLITCDPDDYDIKVSKRVSVRTCEKLKQ